MRLSRWSSLLLLLQLSCVLTFAQTIAPPKKMRLCANVGCFTLTWNGDHYDAVKDGQTKLDGRYWINQWNAEGIELDGTTAYAADGVFPIKGTFTGTIGPSGNRVDNGIDNWTLGYSKSGTLAFTLTWDKGTSADQIPLYVGQYQTVQASKTNPDILLPPGASESYVSYPVDVRAFLQPDMPLLVKDSKRSCRDNLGINGKTALEIARFAYRAGDIERGNCWTMSAVESGNARARVLLAISYQMGWRGPKDDARAFFILKTYQNEKDAWGLLFLTNAYLDAKGTEKNTHEAAIITSYMITHSDTMAAMDLVGSDDKALMAQKSRMELFMNPPMKTAQRCYSTGPSSTVPGAPKNQRCEEISVPDDGAMQRQLNQIDHPQ